MNYKRMMFFGMLFLVFAMLAQRVDAPDGLKGMLFGVSIGCNLLSARMKCKAMR